MPDSPNATAIEPGIIARLTRGVRGAVSGLRGGHMGPGQPPAVQAPPGSERAFDYAVGTNLHTRPTRDSGVTFAQLRGMADGYDLVRLAIETRKDQMCRLLWDIRRRDDQTTDDPAIEGIRAQLRHPDNEHPWSTWLRMLLEEMFVLDAVVIQPRMTRGGVLTALELIDGSTIKRVIDLGGRTPEAPSVAYQQVIKGLPTTNFSRDQLLYYARNKRINKVYGFSHVEQIVMTVNIALRRQMHQLEYYTDGNIPEALVGTPPEWSADNIAEFQLHWDTLIEGDTAKRRKMKFVPGDIARNYKPTREPVLKDEFDEWLARVVCYAFSLPPTAFIKQMNRATAETSHTAALEEGIDPTKIFIKDFMDLLLVRFFRTPHLEFVWRYEASVDRLKQAQIHKTYVAAGVISPNEARRELGLPARDGGEKFVEIFAGPSDEEVGGIRANVADPANSTD